LSFALSLPLAVSSSSSKSTVIQLTDLPMQRVRLGAHQK
jgi:hypothetical protein